jgi:hypothetical protein
VSYLLYMDESGHDGRRAPDEVRGGVAIHASRVWDLVRNLRDLEILCFGAELGNYGSELKGLKVLDRKRYKWAALGAALDDASRQKHSTEFLEAGRQGHAPRRSGFVAYGQASLLFVREMFKLLERHQVKLFAAVVPSDIRKPCGKSLEEHLRKDHVFLFERYFYYLESMDQHGLVVMDETDREQDRQFLRRMRSYFTKTEPGRYRTSRIVPMPHFVASDMTHLVQVADICIYCVNWGFRLPHMTGAVRPEIADEFGPWLHRLQFHGDGERNGQVFQTWGIVFVPDPYEARQAQ